MSKCKLVYLRHNEIETLLGALEGRPDEDSHYKKLISKLVTAKNTKLNSGNSTAIGEQTKKKIHSVDSTVYEELLSMMNNSKAAAVREFVNMMIGARESGFVQSSTPTLAEVHQVANWHIVERYGAEYLHLEDEWGKTVYNLCKQGEEGESK